MNDVLPAEIGTWQHFEACTRELLSAYGYEEIRVPVVEHTSSSSAPSASTRDVVGKEMYTFIDRGGDSLTLRPEATAGIVRALISNGLLRGQRHKLWCLGPMFRHETPQAGRYRQFWQVDVEASAARVPMWMRSSSRSARGLWQRLGITGLRLQINSLARRTAAARIAPAAGVPACARSAARLRQPAAPRRQPAAGPGQQAPGNAGGDSRRAAPHEHLDPESHAHFDALCSMLRAVGVSYEINPRLVRGLDYYNARCSSGSLRPPAHRMPYAPAAATTA